MKLVSAIIQPTMGNKVKEALQDKKISRMTLVEVEGFGEQKGQTELFRGHEYEVSFRPKVKIEIVCKDKDKDDVVKVIVDTARTGKIGDGKIWVVPVEEMIRIRTGETGDDAV
jgi:nitrogen regulatory protein P-II 1